MVGQLKYNFDTFGIMFSVQFTLSVLMAVRVASIQIEHFVRDRVFDEYVDGTNIVRTSEGARTVLDCSRSCEANVDCVAFYYTRDTQQCQEQGTHSSYMVGLTPMPGTRYYHTSYIPTTTTPVPTTTTTPVPTTTTTPVPPTTTAVPASPVCPVQNGGWATNQLPDNTIAQYLIFNDVSVDQSTAVAHCISHGGNLPKFVSAAKMDFYLNNIIPCSDVNGYKFWVDGVNTASNYDYITHDGEVVPRIPELWAAFRPNKEWEQHCIQSRENDFNYFFDDYGCDNAEHQILCEKILA